jgi:outer membrane protein assembly factor BamB
MRTRSAGVLLLLALLLSTRVGAENWPHWRGPFLNGSTTETGLPTTWSKTENVAWVTPMPGPGSSTPIVWGDRVFVTSVEDKSKMLVAICVDAKDGKVLWSQRVAKERQFRNNNGAAPSAVTDGKMVVFAFGTGDLVAFDFNGEVLWNRNLEVDFGEIVLQYGYSSSPLLYKGKLYMMIMQSQDPNAWGRKSDRKGPLDSWLLAIDPKNGEYLWKEKRNTDAGEEAPESYNTPMLCEYPDRAEVIMVGGEYATGHDAETGKEAWRWEFTPHNREIWQRTVPSTVCHEGLIYFARPQHRALYALKAGGKGKLGDDLLAWQYTEATPDVITSLVYKGRLYSMNDKTRDMVCHDLKTGKVIWREKLGLGDVVRASPTGADGKVYLINQAGDVVVLEAGDQFKVVSRIRMAEAPVKSSIAAANGKLFIRTAKNLYCIAGAGK